MKWTNFQVQVFARKWHNSHAGGSGVSTNASCVQVRVSKCICAQRPGWGGVWAVLQAGIIYSDSPWGEHH